MAARVKPVNRIARAKIVAVRKGKARRRRDGGARTPRRAPPRTLATKTKPGTTAEVSARTRRERFVRREKPLEGHSEDFLRRGREMRGG